MQDSVALAVALLASIGLRTIGILAVIVIVLEALYLMAVTVFITGRPGREKSQ